MASHPPGQCCTVGVKHEGTPNGEIKSIGDVKTYFAYPKDESTENCVVVLPDVMGLEATNARLIADQFAANGYFCVIPDLFHGDPVPIERPPGFDVMKWLNGPPGHLPDRVDPVITSVVKALRSEYKVKRIGSVGYCFGAKYVFRFLGEVGSSNSATIDAGCVAHPSFVDEAEVKAIRGPLSIAAAEVDEIFPEEKRHLSEKILKELSGGPEKLPYQVVLYSGVHHGFAVRGDVKDKRAKFAKEHAFIQAVQWFDTFLKQ